MSEVEIYNFSVVIFNKFVLAAINDKYHLRIIPSD